VAIVVCQCHILLESPVLKWKLMRAKVIKLAQKTMNIGSVVLHPRVSKMMFVVPIVVAADSLRPRRGRRE